MADAGCSSTIAPASCMPDGLETAAPETPSWQHKPDGRLAATFRRLRLAQIRTSGAVMEMLNRLRPVASLVARARRWPLVRPLVDRVAGYNRVLPNLATARKVAARYRIPGADSAVAARALHGRIAATRPSDYPVLFYLSRLPLDGIRVFDLGGAIGNVFFLYHRYLAFPLGLRWIVHDLPGNMARGRELARQSSEVRLQFTKDIYGASGCDVLLVSGSLHYFDFTLTDYIARLADRPKHVLVNRTPLVDAPTAATVQYDPGVVMVPCRLLNRAELIAEMEQLGYRLVDSWRAPELSIKLPYDLEYCVREYSGAYFRQGG